MTRWYGMCNDTARAVFGSFDPSAFMVYFCDEDDPERRTVQDLNALAVKYRDAFDDTRRIVAVIKGSVQHGLKVRRGLSPVFEAAVFAAPLEVLRRLNVKVLDEGWTEEQPQLLFDEIMAQPDEEAEFLEAPR